jgi:hypothetical protein
MPPARSGDYYLDAPADRRIDMAIVYCSSRGRYAGLKSERKLMPIPADLQIGPQFGLVVLRDSRPEALLLALAILSPESQAILAGHGSSARQFAGEPLSDKRAFRTVFQE